LVSESQAAIAPPSRPLSPEARWIWHAEAVVRWSVVLIVAIAVDRWIDSVPTTLAWILVAIGFVPWVVIAPDLRWRHWRWDVRPEVIHIRHGTVTIRETLILMLRVQHVETTQGVIERARNLATVRVYTTAGSHQIPLLPRSEADRLRDRIADLARIADAP
jgi:membrane protein YdbS with pleckstrin-like domain